jgi:gluconate 5-dehydrogenase
MGSELFDLSQKTALVTGGSRGIGFAIAQGLAEHGADVAILARTEHQLTKIRGQIQAKTDRSVWVFSFDLANTEGKGLEMFLSR